MLSPEGMTLYLYQNNQDSILASSVVVAPILIDGTRASEEWVGDPTSISRLCHRSTQFQFRFSKASHLVQLKGLPTAMEIATPLFHHVFRVYGLPEDIVTDRGPQFTSRVWQEFCKLLGINVSLSSDDHPQANGQVERLNQEIEHYLRSYCTQEQQRWSEFLWAEYAQNLLIHLSTGLTPFQCVGLSTSVPLVW